MKSSILFFAAGMLCALAHAAAPDLDLSIRHYSRVLTPEGVTRESRYEETMLRRPGHVWLARVLPPNAAPVNEHAHHHKEFNHVMTPRHLVLEENQLRLEFVDAHRKEVIAVPATEYENVDFDGSWDNSYYLVSPQLLAAIPLSPQVSAVAGAHWREREKDGVFQRVLWDEGRQIALTIESGDRAGTFYRRVDVTPLAGARGALPWSQIQGYGQKDYADFLD